MPPHHHYSSPGSKGKAKAESKAKAEGKAKGKPKAKPKAQREARDTFSAGCFMGLAVQNKSRVGIGLGDFYFGFLWAFG